MMLSVSLAAGSFVASLLDELEAGEGVAVRLKLQRGRRLMMRLDYPESEDVQIRHGRRVILLLEPGLQRILQEQKLHLQLSPSQDRLSFALAG